MSMSLNNLRNSQAFMKFFNNSSWMFFEYLLKIISGIFVSIYIARYLGPESYGVLTYALAMVAVFMAVSRLGMDNILVRDLAKYPDRVKEYMGTAFIIMIVAAFICIVFLLMLVSAFESDPGTKVYIFIISSGLVFQVFLIIDYNFQSQVKAKYSSIAKSVAIMVSSSVKIYLVLSDYTLLYIVISYAFDHLLIAIMLVVVHLRKREVNFVQGFNHSLVKPILRSAWPMVLSAVAVMLYMRVDQIMIMNIMGASDLGIYAAASKLFEGWVMLPYIISISLITAIVKYYEEDHSKFESLMTRLYIALIWGGVVVALITNLFSESIISFVFGKSYVEASIAFSIFMWVAIFSSINSLNARYFTIANFEKKIATRTIAALIINVIFNFIFIPVWGIEGAVMSTLLSTMVAALGVDIFDKDLMQLNRVRLNALIFNKKTLASFRG